MANLEFDYTDWNPLKDIYPERPVKPAASRAVA